MIALPRGVRFFCWVDGGVGAKVEAPYAGKAAERFGKDRWWSDGQFDEIDINVREPDNPSKPERRFTVDFDFTLDACAVEVRK